MTDTPRDDDEVLGALADEIAASGTAHGRGDADAPTRCAMDAALRLAGAGLLGDEGARAVLDAFGDDAELPPPVLPDDYELLGEIGRGGMGVVHRARQRSLDRLVAVKVLRSGGALLGTALRRFEKEARALARLRHRHIVAVHEVGETQGQVWFTMDLIEGSSLEAALREGPMPPAQAVRILRQVASAVAYVHSHGLVHRDLKPANILLDRSGDAVVTDFGLAIEVGTRDRFTLTGQVLGTPAYMSPEQARGDAAAVGEATDVWAMGAVLYECLTGRRPFDGPSPAELAYAVIHADPAPPRSLDRRIPDDLESVCMKALAKRPQDRYATARAFLEDLERFDQGVPVRAQPPSRWRRTGRFLTRHRRSLALSAASAVAAAVIAGVAVTALLQRDPDALTKLGDELAARGEQGAAHFVYSRAVETAGEKASQSMVEKAREAAIAEARALLVAGRPADAVKVADAAIADGDRRENSKSWPGRVRLRWERFTAAAAAGGPAPTPEAFSTLLIEHRQESAVRPRSVASIVASEDREDRFVADLADEAFADLRSREPGLRQSAMARIRGISSWSPLDGGLSTALRRALDADVGTVGDALEAAFEIDDGPFDLSQLAARVRSAAFAAAATRTRPVEEALAATVEDPQRSDDARRAAAQLLGEITDLPVAIDRNWPSTNFRRRLSFRPERIVAAWRDVRDLDRAASLRRRVEMAVLAAEAAKDRPEGWTNSVETLPECDPNALREWLERHTGQRWKQGSHAQFAADVRAWWNAHGQEDPALWFVAALKLGKVPATSERPALIHRMRANPSEARWIHDLLRLIVPAAEPVPLLQPFANDRDVVAAWTSSLPAGTPLRLRTACVALVGGRWQMVERTSASAPLSAKSPVTLRREVPWNAETATTWGFHVPGLGTSGTSAPPTAEHALVVVVEYRNGEPLLRVAEDRVLTRSAGGSGSTSHSGEAFPPGCVVALDSNVGGDRSPDTFRHEVTLAIAEPDEGAAPEWTLDQWRERIAADADGLAARMERAAAEPEFRDVGLSPFFQQFRALAALTASVPVPEARAALARIAAQTGSGLGWLDNAQILRTGRLLAGDAAALPEPKPDDEFGREGTGKDADARRWLRIRLAADDPQIRAVADERLQDAEWKPEDHECAADAVAAGAIDPPDWMRARLASDAAAARTPAAVLRDRWSLLVPSFLWLAAVVAALVSATRTRRSGYAPLGAGATLVVLGFLCDGIDLSVGTRDLLPATAGAVVAAIGVLVLLPAAAGRAARVALAGFGGAATASLVGLAGIDMARTAVAPLGMAVGVCALPALARAVRRNPETPVRRFSGMTMAAAPVALALGVLAAAVVDAEAALWTVAVAAAFVIAWLVLLPTVWSSARSGNSARTVPIAFGALYVLPVLLVHGAWIVGLTGLLGADAAFHVKGDLAGVLLLAIALAAIWAVANLGHAGWTRWSRLR